jgi:hypothetical protein
MLGSIKLVSLYHGRGIAQAVSRCLPTAAVRVRARVWSSGIRGGQRGAGAGFLRVLRFPLPIFIPPNSPSSQSPGEVVADVPSGLNTDPPPSPPTMRIIKNYLFLPFIFAAYRFVN